MLVDYFQQHPIQIGGPGVVVEGDETYLSAKKKGRGRRVRRNPKWLLGLVERGSNLSFITEVPNRQAATLLPLIERHVMPGTTISTDMNRAYGR